MRKYLAALCVCLAPIATPTLAQQPADDWAQQKCAAYAAAWTQALDFYGSDQMNYAFIAGNENFIAGGCTATADICPQSQQELEVSNALTLALMNAGTASTFLPFRCAEQPLAPGGWSGPGL